MDLKSTILQSLEPKIGIPYKIEKTEELKTAFGPTLKISLQNMIDVKDRGSILAAIRDEVGEKSKLGSFITLLGSETDDWLNRVIVFKVWEDKNRVIIDAPLSTF